MSKFNGIISTKDQELVNTVFSQIDINTRDKTNIIETIENMVYLHPTYFKNLRGHHKLTSLITLATFIDMLIDKEINPLSKRYTLKALNVFNNNIFEIERRKLCVK